jgi:hypothetical protein
MPLVALHVDHHGRPYEAVGPFDLPDHIDAFIEAQSDPENWVAQSMEPAPTRPVFR